MLTTNSKLQMRFRLAPTLLTLDDRERTWMLFSVHMDGRMKCPQAIFRPGWKTVPYLALVTVST